MGLMNMGSDTAQLPLLSKKEIEQLSPGEKSAYFTAISDIEARKEFRRAIGLQSKSGRIKAPFEASQLLRGEIFGWSKLIKTAIIGLIIVFLVFGGFASVMALLAFWPWYVWLIIISLGVLIWRRIRQ